MKIVDAMRDSLPNVEFTSVPRNLFVVKRGSMELRRMCTPECVSVLDMHEEKYYCIAAAAALISFTEVNLSSVFANQSMKVEFHTFGKSIMIGNHPLRFNPWRSHYSNFDFLCLSLQTRRRRRTSRSSARAVVLGRRKAPCFRKTASLASCNTRRPNVGPGCSEPTCFNRPTIWPLLSYVWIVLKSLLLMKTSYVAFK